LEHLQLGKIFDVTGQREPPSMNIARPYRPTTIPKARSKSAAGTCKAYEREKAKEGN